MTAPSFAGQPPFLVGRERELAVLRDHLTAALNGSGSLVLIGGEAGIGKTALAEVLCHEATKEGALVLTGRSFDLAETPPFGPWIDLFAHYKPTGDLPPSPAPFAERGTVGTVANQAALFHAVLDFLAALSSSRPLVVLLEDAHWQDVASFDLLRFLGREVAALRILLLVTYRSEEVTRRHPLYALLPILVREANAARLDVRPLHAESIRALVAGRYDLNNTDATRLVDYLTARSEGNPFFLDEVLRTLEEQEVLRPLETGWTFGALGGIHLPPLLRQVIDGRLARLSDEAQELLAVAAVIGQDVPFDVWMTVTGRNEAAPLETVEQAVAAHLVVPLTDGSGFAWTHALIREALYEGVLPLRRRILHRQVAETLAALPHPDPDAVAFQFQRAGDDRAGEWLITAGKRAQAAFAWRTATERYEAALSLLPDAETRTRGWLLYRIGRMQVQERYLTYFTEAMRLADKVGDRALAAAARYGRGLLQIRLGVHGLGLEELTAGAEALEALPPADRARARANAVTVSEREVPLGAVLMHTGHAGRYTRALELGEEWLIPAASAPDADATAPVWAEGWIGLASTYLGLGRVAESRWALARARAGYEREGLYLNAAVADWIMLRWLALPYAADDLGEREQVLARAMEAAERARGVWEGPLDWLGVSLRFVEGRWADAGFAQVETLMRERPDTLVIRMERPTLAWWYRERGERRRAWAQVEAVLPHGVVTEPGEIQLPIAVATQEVAVALALDEGDLPLAHAWLEAHDHWLDWSGALRGRSEGAALWARYHHQQGDATQALMNAERALAHARAPRQPLALLAAHRLCGELATESGQYADAESHLNQSLALADACAAPYEHVLTLLALAALHTATQRPADARLVLDEAKVSFVALGAKPALARADAIATRLDATHAAPPTAPAGLSAREVEVLRLVAEGLSNPQIGERLFLSPRTIEHHLHAIFTKTGVSSRAAAARWASEHALS